MTVSRGKLVAPAILAVTLALICGCKKTGAEVNAGDKVTTSDVSSPVHAFSLTGEPCAIVDKATDVVNTIDHVTQITTVVGNGSPQPGEARLVGGKSYVLVNGAWHVSDTTASDTAAMLAERKKTAKETCKALGDETLNGVDTALFSAHVENDGSVSDNKIWIEKNTGLPVKTVSSLEGGTVITQLNSYTGVTAPKI